MDTGEATWNTPSHPSTAGSKAPSSSKFAWNKWSLSLEQKNNRPVFKVEIHHKSYWENMNVKLTDSQPWKISEIVGMLVVEKMHNESNLDTVNIYKLD